MRGNFFSPFASYGTCSGRWGLVRPRMGILFALYGNMEGGPGTAATGVARERLEMRSGNQILSTIVKLPMHCRSVALFKKKISQTVNGYIMRMVFGIEVTESITILVLLQS